MYKELLQFRTNKELFLLHILYSIVSIIYIFSKKGRIKDETFLREKIVKESVMLLLSFLFPLQSNCKVVLTITKLQ